MRVGRGPDDAAAGGGAEGPDRGQTTVEFVGMVPLILVVLALMWQLVLVGYTFTLAGNAADEAARAAAVDGDCQGAAREHLPSAWQGTVGCGDGAAGLVTATVELRVPVLFPGMADLPLTVTGEAGAVREEER
ncbi:TadE/TadG family type IV pilus assembly protein [Streptomyces sp. TRM 70361]|uniref:TadE/TadG family type IV pilus assembly protein n=1 Tax=Streptomyces sp. TRM 70361 TaxID=3116553 RepID=UPI002E7BE946|nr:TadE/TadG family type IV pilus assembly protein [Streptomyces sp. TRM 70361]MEE1939284.1 TadE/TadG family type IV pilus assembly protein [Streptomyces sp. TRM 70361]